MTPLLFWTQCSRLPGAVYCACLAYMYKECSGVLICILSGFLGKSIDDGTLAKKLGTKDDESVDWVVEFSCTVRISLHDSGDINLTLYDIAILARNNNIF